jgi:uncharacterized protein YbjT (DUF2867 family)
MSKIIVTGATGTIGSRVVERLVAEKRDVVAVVRDAAKAKAMAAAGADLREATFEDPASLRRAFEGADVVVLITPANAHGREQGEAAITAARDANVRKIVRISALKADTNGPTENTRQHGHTEAALKSSGLTYVILRPHFFMQNLFGSVGSIKGEGRIYWGTGDGRLGMVDTRDVSDAAAVAATTGEFDGQTLELTGPESIDYHAVAARVGKALGREVAYVPVPPSATGEALRSYGADDWTVRVIVDYCTAYSKNWGDFTTDEVKRVTGRPARSIDDFAREMLKTD